MEQKNNNTEKILSSLESINRMAAPDFFYTRLRVRMDKDNGIVIRRKWMLRPVYAIAVMALLLTFNIAIMFQDRGNETTVVNDEIENLRTIASAYHLNDNLLYDINQ